MLFSVRVLIFSAVSVINHEVIMACGSHSNNKAVLVQTGHEMVLTRWKMALTCGALFFPLGLIFLYWTAYTLTVKCTNGSSKYQLFKQGTDGFFHFSMDLVTLSFGSMWSN